MIVEEGSRLLREKQQLKIPQEAVFADEEAEALPAESELPGVEINAAIASQFIAFKPTQQSFRKHPYI
ncbi:hypothetical protein FCL54_05825 [Pseudalkalibacillus caeni]|uniref:Uncharacterized protein n=1 Tax=Exobacillus caeni TaxID=2574798 RepID=A0A5R9FFJ3_9BACL|nr:hypothetical protein FCL54_05825 [Pseudalkalibacillus caeni]